MASLAEQWTTQVVNHLDQGVAGSGRVNDLRRSGAEAFRKYGLPHRKVEDWKYTSLKLLEARSHRIDATGWEMPASVAGHFPEPLLDQDCTVVRLLNGRPEAGFSVAGGARILSLAQALADDSLAAWAGEMLKSLEIDGPALAFSALNTSMLGDGLIIDVPAGADGGVMSLQWAFDPAPPAMLFNPRIVIRMGDGASLNLVEQFESAAPHAHGLNLVMQARLGDGARLNHLRLQQECDEAALILRCECEVQPRGRYRASAFDWGGGLVRHDTRVVLLGSAAEAEVNGAFVLGDNRHLDHHVFVDHAAEQGRSSQFFRGVLGGRSRGVFNGKARIRQGADGTSVRQSNANLLLSPLAEMDTKPELEIYADEIEASHGATVGQLDENAVFYMRSRGLEEDQARGMLTSAFCKAVLDRTTDLPVSLCKEIARRMESALEDVVGAAPSPRPDVESWRLPAPTRQ